MRVELVLLHGIEGCASGSGVHSSTSSSISLPMLRKPRSLRGEKTSHLLGILHEVLSRVIGACSGLEKCPNGENDEYELQSGSTRVILVGRLDVSRNDVRSRNLEESILCCCERVRQEDSDVLQGRLRRAHPSLCTSSSELEGEKTRLARTRWVFPTIPVNHFTPTRFTICSPITGRVLSLVLALPSLRTTKLRHSFKES